MTTSTAIGPGQGSATQAGVVRSAPAAATADHPGRWVGGLIGALLSLGAAMIATFVTRTSAVLLWDAWSMIGLLGVPIGFILGRELLPMARGAGWQRALVTGMLLGWVAPPLGAIEILGGSRLFELGNTSSSFAGPITLALLPIAIPVSFVAVFMTIPVGLAWGVLVRLVPTDALASLRVARPLERLGVRHAIAVTAVALLLLELVVRS